MNTANRLTARVLGVFLALDVAFKALTFPPFTYAAGLSTPADRWRAALLLVGLIGPAYVLWGLVVATLLRPVERWLDTPGENPEPPIVGAAVDRLHRLPLLIGLLWPAEWLGVFTVLGLYLGTPLFTPAALLFFGTLALGPLPLAYVITIRLLSVSTAAASITARRLGVPTRAPSFTLRHEMALFGLSLAMAPSLYVGSIAFTARTTLMPLSELTLVIAFLFAAVTLFAVLCAWFLSDSLATPVDRMAEVIRTIAEQGDTALVGRVPMLRRDELGTLAEWTNAMIDRLEQTEARRAAIAASLESLNHTLEQRVEERTQRLAEANASLAQEMATRTKMELELRQGQKLEAVGRLAAGVAHEINTPVQFVSDSVHFVRDAFTELKGLIASYQALVGAVLAGHPSVEAARRIGEAEEDADLDYLLDNVPKALDRSIDGLQRLSVIVRSMKEFAHPDQKEMAAVDLNHAIQSTLTIARSEYKYVADLELDLGSLPFVTCHGGDVNQVILNLVINAAHAIGDVVKGTTRRGTIRVHTHQDGGAVVVAIGDTGSGIPEHVRERIFEPFFTTKEVGRGTGQGLAIARAVVVEKHGGELTFTTEIGAGTTFLIRLPIEGRGTTGAEALAH